MRCIKRKVPSISDIVILYDDRERKPWVFPMPWPMKRKRLPAGDYTIEGYEDLIAIEKKSGLLELFGNLTGKDRVRFEKALLKLSKVPFNVLVIEDDYSNYEAEFRQLKHNSKGRCMVNKSSLDCWLSKIAIEYSIPVLFIGKPPIGVRAIEERNGILTWLVKIAYEQAINYKGPRHGKA